MSTLFEQATAFIEKATEFDNKKDYEHAFEYYKKGVNTLLVYLKFEKNPYLARNVQMRCVQYLDRAEAIREKKEKPIVSESGSEDSVNEGVSALRRQLLSVIVTERPNIKWEDVAGLEYAKEELRTSVILPILHPELFSGKRQPWSGILLFGPPGTGKSFLAKAVASQSSSTFFSVSASDLLSKWQGESARLVKELFQMAREKKPSIIFIDEIDSLCGSRDDDNMSAGQRQVLTELLVQMDGVGKDQTGVLVLGATNVPWDIDAAMRRRFQKRIYIPLPDENARRVMFKIHFGKEGHTLKEEDFVYLATMTDGFSGSDIADVARQALNYPIRELQRCEFFKKNKKGLWEPALEDDKEAVHTTVFKLKKGEVVVPTFRRENIPMVMSRAAKASSAKELVRYVQWTKDFGEEGV